jgi:hypothetical protein
VLGILVGVLDRLSDLHASAQIDPDGHGHANSHHHINQLYINRIAFAHDHIFFGTPR